ncbi:MAG TPA: histidine kinase [Bacteroidota bacterium]|nr:histidine kinase [Bacteroidota bacterium]
MALLTVGKFTRRLWLWYLLFSLSFISLMEGSGLPPFISALDGIKVSQEWFIAKDDYPFSQPPVISDTLWKPFEEYGSYSTGNWVIRTSVEISDSSLQNEAIGLILQYFMTAYEVYWDNEKIISNGRLGRNFNEEQPGITLVETILPSRLLRPGNHIVILRVSHYHDYTPWKWYHGQLRIGNYISEVKNTFKFSYMLFFTAGIVLIPFCFCLFLLLTKKGKLEHLFLCLACFIIILDHISWQLQYYIDLPSVAIHWVFVVYLISRILRSILFPLFCLYVFFLPYRKIWSLVIILFNLAMAFIVASFWTLSNTMIILMLVECTMITLFAIVQKRDGSLIFIIGCLIAWCVYRFEFTLMGTGSVLAIFATLVIAMQYVRKEESEREAKLKAVRLENELLKKSINPHFLLNSLTSVIAWIRKEPRSAIKLIEALSVEFRTIIQVSPLKLIPLAQEIELCQSHLKIMSYRKGIQYTLQTINIRDKEYIPPMVFHTLIENGLTHSCGKSREPVTFTIEEKSYADHIQYIVSHNGPFNCDDEKKSDGIGMRYIKARLEESYPQRWNVEAGGTRGQWKTIIEIWN